VPSDQQPGDRLRAGLGGERHAVQAHDGAGGEQDQVEAPEHLAELGLLLRDERALSDTGHVRHP
jgi:hypothetical protein